MTQTLFKRIPFDLELAKKIANKEVKGHIETNSGEKARIICFDMKYGPRSKMVVLIDTGNYECEKLYGMDGKVVGENDFRFDLHIKLPINPDFVPEDNTNSQPHQFKPFDKVLVRDNEECDWVCNIFSHMDSDNEYVCLYMRWPLCIPYKGNEHLLGTTDKPE